jgi:hypothetical protein
VGSLLDLVRRRLRESGDRPAPRAAGASLAQQAPSSLRGYDRAAARRVTDIIEEGDGRGNIATDRLVILNMGLGRDSMAMLALLAEGRLRAEGARVRPRDLDAIVFSDPGLEWDHTYAAIADVDRLLAEIQSSSGVRVPFYVLKKPPKAAWDAYLATMREEWDRGVRGASHEPHRAWRRALGDASIEEKALGGYYHILAPIDVAYSRGRPSPYAIDFGKTACTDGHKVQVIRRFMLDLAKQKFGEGYSSKGWADLVQAGEKAPHVNLLGIAAGEGSEVGGPRELHMHPLSPHRVKQHAELTRLSRRRARQGYKTSKLDKKIKSLERGGPLYVSEAYPLVEMGIAKEDEQRILERHGLGHIKKSGCVFCHSQPPEWYWVLWEKARRGDPWAQTSLDRIVAYEAASMGYRDSRGQCGKAIFTKKPWQAADPSAPRSGVLRGDDRRGLLEVIPIITERKVEPRIQAHMGRGLGRRAATDAVMEEILRKDYAQGCELPGSTNRDPEPLGPCWRHERW